MNLKVLMLGWELPPFNSGGLGVACLGLAKALAQKGVHITFVLPKKLDINYNFMDLVFANVLDASELANSYNSSWNRYFGVEYIENGDLDYVKGALKFGEAVKNIVKKYNVDLIHAHDWLTYPAGVAAKEAVGKPLIAHIHSTEFDRTGGNNPNPLVYDIEKRGLLAADCVMPVAGFVRETLINKYGISPHKIRVIYNGLTDEFKPDLPTTFSLYKKLGYKIVLFLGRITLQKGPEYFVWAAKRVLEYIPKVLFVVVGSGDMQDFMVSETLRLGINDKFLFTGFLRGDEKHSVYKSADCYVMPSVSEPFGITALESVANGTPTIISKQSGVSEILKNTLKVDFWDVDEMSNKIISCLKYEPLLTDLRNESTKEIPNFTWSKSADEVIRVYRQLV